MNEEQDNTTTPNLETNTSAESHDEVMAHFQEITNFYDMEQCQAILESTNWNLDQAIQSFFNGGGVTQQMDEDIEEVPTSDITNDLPSPFLINNIVENSNNLNIQSNGIFATGTSINPISR